MAAPGVLNLAAGFSAATQALIAQAFPPPTPNTSWVSYECWTETDPDSGVVVGTTLPSTPLIPTQSNYGHWDALNSQTLPSALPQSTVFAPLAEMIDAANAQSEQNGAAQVFVQQRSAPIINIFLVGRAVRIAFPIPCPEIVSIGGVKPILTNRSDRGEGFRQGIVGYCDCPVYGANWRLRYTLPTPPDVAVPVPPNTLG